MQGGVRRKNDLLPRYRGQSGSGAKKSLLTTPMKKTLIYILMLVALYFAAQVILSERNAEPRYELESADSGLGLPENGNEADRFDSGSLEGQGSQADAKGKAKVPKEGFNNEVARQEEVKNLEEHEMDYKKTKSPSAKDNKQEVGNDVKAMKQVPDTDESVEVDEQAKKINEKAPYKKTDTDDTKNRGNKVAAAAGKAALAAAGQLEEGVI
ncbi:LADA_0G09142g1_1 [Lachancea dasiensis]|uniref:LADA_0G09142g1_1 n=1 Tax=Lachancea dasiensis TaxID=1072105 RepID=A0A1G4JUA3_9SACH|nr:LADA_0G09142g1_1 [Lachancea dasiensis]